MSEPFLNHEIQEDLSSSADVFCRACAKSNLLLINIFQPLQINGCNSEIADALAEFTSLKISRLDGKPQNICQACLNTLNISYSFRQQVLKADEELHWLIKEQKHCEIKNEPLDVNWRTNDDLKIEYDDSIEFECNDFTNDVANDGTEERNSSNKKKTLLCTICSKSFHEQKSLNKHLAKHISQYKRPPCKTIFSTDSELNRHISYNNCIDSDHKDNLKLENENSYLNTISEEKYSNQSVQDHFVSHKSDYVCPVCNCNYKSESQLMEHVNTHAEIKVEPLEFQCTDCDLKFSKKRSLAMHRKKHTNRKCSEIPMQYQCDYCSKFFSTKPLLRRHLKLHGGKHFTCDKCPKKYSRQDQLIDHMNKHSGVKTNICPYCSKSFSQLCTLKDHIRTHTGETPFLCSECGKGFTNSSNLKQHMMRHTGLKPFACTLCPKTFCTKGQMTCHMGTHTGIHPYKCDQCDSTFTKRNSLKKHKMIHLGIKPFQCDTCPMRFTIKDHLRRHYRIHTGEKPYSCKYCSRSFTQSNDLVKHIRIHVGTNIYECSICNLRFRTKSDLKKHYPTHYINGEDPPVIQVGKNQSAPVIVMKNSQCSNHEWTKENVIEDESGGTNGGTVGGEKIDDVEMLNTVGKKYTITVNPHGATKKDGIAGEITINIDSEKILI